MNGLNKVPIKMFRMLKYLAIFTFFVSMTSSAKHASIMSLFDKGFMAYSEERWSECIANFEEALHLYKLHKSIIINCSLKCGSHQYKPVVVDDIENLRFYENIIAQRNCLSNCEEKEFDKLNLHFDIDEHTLRNMQMKKSYEYLHICYFQMNALPKAASAAYTYVIANPNNKQMLNNLNYYIQQNEVDSNELIDLDDSKQFIVSYKLGVKAFNQENWIESISHMEEVLKDYLYSENSCRAECNQLPEQQWTSEFLLTTSNNIAALLQCKQNCQNRIQQLGYDSGIHFLADVLNYLQISYYHLDKIKDAAVAVESYLAIFPTDEDMTVNKEIYSTLVEKEAFIPRQDIIIYSKRDNYEKVLLNIFEKKINY